MSVCQYDSRITKHDETGYIPEGTTSLAVPGTAGFHDVPERCRQCSCGRKSAGSRSAFGTAS